MGDILPSLFTAAIVGAGIGLFYFVLLNAHGFTRVKYKYVFLSIFVLLICLSFFGFQAVGFTAFTLGIGVFVLAIALFARGMANSLKESSTKLFADKNKKVDTQKINDTNIASYVGVVFHLVVIILISLSIFTYSNDVILDQNRMERLIGDAFFQFYSTIMLMLLGLFNPFVSPSERLMGFAERIDKFQYPKWHKLLSDKRNWVTAKAIICVLIIAYFVNDGLFNFPSWDGGNLLMNGYLILIGFYVFMNLMQLIRTPDLFFKRNLFRLTLLFKSAYLSIFVGAILVFSTLFFSSILGFDPDNLKVSSEAILFLGFNILMCYNEYRLARA
ncbi:MAG: hypothetical protein EOO87_15940 [Pedobacter sp.]|nr:MAG: hypothetical protein EOO87_15940 [Pedobacter sp.]